MIIRYYSSPFVLRENNQGDVFIAIKDLFDIMMMYKLEKEYVLNEIGIRGITGLESGLKGFCTQKVKNKHNKLYYKYDPYKIIISDEPRDLMVRVEELSKNVLLYILLRRNLKKEEYVLDYIL